MPTVLSAVVRFVMMHKLLVLRMLLQAAMQVRLPPEF